VIRVTVALCYRSGAEMQVGERTLGDLGDLEDARDAVDRLIFAATDEHADEITHDGAELIIRLAHRSYEPMVEPSRSTRPSSSEPTVKIPRSPLPKRIPKPGQF
jgi:hypothetical protein